MKAIVEVHVFFLLRNKNKKRAAKQAYKNWEVIVGK